MAKDCAMRKSPARFFLITLAMFASGTAPASAQGVFDLGVLTNTLSQGTPSSAPPPTPTQTAKLNFKPSPAVRAANIAKFVAGMKHINADAGAQMEQAFAQMDVFTQIEQGLVPFGLHIDNIADAYTVYFMNGWMAANGRLDQNTKEQAAGTKASVERVFASSPDIGKLSDEDKQSMAEGLLLQAMLYDMMLQGSASDPAAFKKVQADVRAALKESSIDVDLFELKINGLLRKP
jgi:hypothetical protein